MDCHKYIEEFLTADADGELSAEDSRAAAAHLAGCVSCRQRFEAERALKALLRKRMPLAATPAAIQARITAALDQESSRGGAWAGLPRLRDVRLWVPVAIAAMAVLAIVGVYRGRQVALTPQLSSGDSVVAGNPAFEWATGQFAKFERKFEPNVPANSLAGLTEHYNAHTDFPTYVWDFSQLGFSLVGGRVDRMKDGRPVAFTLYHGPRGAIMCVRYRVESMPIPAGARDLNGLHHFYRYKGYSVCLTVERGVCCMLVTRMAVADFLAGIDRLES